MTDTIQIHVNHIDSGYAWASCAKPITRKFLNEAAAKTFAETIGGVQHGLYVAKPCSNTVKFDPKAYHSLCAVCGTVWQLNGDVAYLDDEGPIK